MTAETVFFAIIGIQFVALFVLIIADQGKNTPAA